MSADHWDVCPRCEEKTLSEGPYPTEPTFREDYEFYGAQTGTLKISYSGECVACGLRLAFEDSRTFWPEP